MTEQVSAMAAGIVFAGCLSVPLCRRHISGEPADSFFHIFSAKPSNRLKDELVNCFVSKIPKPELLRKTCSPARRRDQQKSIFIYSGAILPDVGFLIMYLCYF